MQIDIISDLTCPWSFIGKRWLEQALAARPEIHPNITWRALQLYPDTPREGIDRDRYLAEKFGSTAVGNRIYANIARAGSAAAIPFAFARIRRMPNTRDAHRLVCYGAAHGKADAAVEALFKAYFVEAHDIGDTAILAQTAGEIGLDARDAAAFLAGPGGIGEVAWGGDDARRAGFSAVPSFVFNRRHAIAGAHRPEILLPILDAAEKDGTAPG